MDNHSVEKLPVINFLKQNSNHGAENWSSTCKNIQRALEEYGCFMAVVKDGVTVPDSKLRTSIFAVADELFDLPKEIKVKNTSNTSFFGYLGDVPEIPLHESMGVGDATSLKAISRLCELMWPDRIHDFCGTIHEYASQLSCLEKLVSSMIFESYGIGRETSESHMDSITFLLRLNSYRVPRQNETTTGAKPHTDMTFITILDQNQVGGLEVKLKDSDEWCKVDFQPSSFIVMAGEGLVAWSNNRIRAPVHQVTILNTGKAKRYSVGLFSFHKGIIHIPQELIDEEHPRQFRPFDHLGLLDYYGEQFRKGRMSGGTVYSYCGV